jgi:hydroxypyruvate isomerase
MHVPMERFSVCIETIFPYTRPYEERMRVAAGLGFTRYEFWYHDMARDESGWVVRENAKETDVLLRLNEELGLKLCCYAVNTPQGTHGGNLVSAEGRTTFMKKLESSVAMARRLGAPLLIAFPGYQRAGVPRKAQLKDVVGALREVDAALEGTGVKVLWEPLSVPKYQGYLLPTIRDVVHVLREAGGKNLKILFDLYHIQVMTGNILSSLEDAADLVGHVHVSGVPGQHEPASGELNLPLVLGKLLDRGYEGAFGLEYYPLLDPETSLRETVRYLLEGGPF